MTHRIHWLALAGALLLTSTASAEPTCAPTAGIATPHYPGAAAIPPMNNLVQPTGKSIPVEGQQLLIEGRVLDSRCIPVSEAVIELWQVDPFGKWFLAEGADLVTPNPVFTGAGRAVTDNEGRFTFTTAFPGAVATGSSKNRVVNAPNLNIRIKADGFPEFRTVLFFANDRRNAADALYKKLPPAARRGVTLEMHPQGDSELVGKIDLVLKGKTPYQTY